MKRWIMAGCLFLFGLTAPAQNIMQSYDKPYNIGVRVGFNSAFPLIHSFAIDGEEITNRRVHYKVGYLAAVTFSVNFNHFFVQPSISWYRNNAEIQFELPLISSNGFLQNNGQSYHKLDSEINSLEVPVLVGYYLVKEGPYGLSVKFGPKIIYHYKSEYSCDSQSISMQHVSDGNRYAMNFVSAVGVTIGQLFLDFSYEFGLHRQDSDFAYRNLLTEQQGVIRLDRRANSLSFSLGCVF